MTAANNRIAKRVAEVLLLFVAIALLIPPVGSTQPTEYVMRLSGVLLGSLAFFASRSLAYGLSMASLAFAVAETAAFFAIGYILRLAILQIAG